MITENTFDKSKLISELKEIHIELVKVYKNIFDYKYHISESFKDFIDEEYKENGISSKERQAWNDNFCHRASYTLLNKILFIRICEDKGFMLNSEDYVAGEPKDPHIGKKLSRIGLQKWANLVTNYTLGELVKLAFLDMKKSYSSISLYKDDKYEMLTPTTEELSLKYLDGDEEAQKLVLQFENALSNIVEKLDTNNYNFNNTDGNILGDVYEKFMDRETRKAIGQFYTPEFVIEYILNNTVAKADVVENPFVSVADISCGSGHFLIMAYDILRERFINNLELLRDKYSNELYTIKKNGKEEELKGRDYWKEENIHYHLLKHCIYGADIDSFAVQLTTINLLLKDLDNFTDELNIVECDSLIKWEEDYDWIDLKQQLEEEFEIVEYNQINLLGEEEKTLVTRKKETYELTYKDIIGIEKTEKISKERAEEIVYLCEFWSKKYSYVVGNPPYVRHEKINIKNYLEKSYKVYSGTADLLTYFIERGLEVLKKGSTIGYIVSDSFTRSHYGEKIRKYIKTNYKIISFKNEFESVKEVFDDAVVNAAILIINNSKPKGNEKFIYNDKLKLIQKELHEKGWYFPDHITQQIKEKMDVKGKKIGEIEDININRGVLTGFDEAFIIDERTRNMLVCRDSKNAEIIYPILRGRDIKKYNIDWDGKYIIFTRRGIEIDKYPHIKDYLYRYYKNLMPKKHKSDTNGRKPGKYQWYEIQDSTNYYRDFFKGKIIFANMSIKNRFYYDDNKYFTNPKTFILTSNKINLKYLSGLLNSSSMFFYFRMITPKLIGETREYRKINVEQVPILLDSKYKEEIIKLVEQLHQNQHECFELSIESFIEYERNKILNKIKKEKAKYRIDYLIYNEYRFSTEEIKCIEKDVNSRITLEKKYYLENLNDLRNHDFFSILIKEKQYFLDKISGVLDKDKFIQEHIVNNKTINDIAEEYGFEYTTVCFLREHYVNKYAEEQPWKFYNLTELRGRISRYFNNVIACILKELKKHLKHIEFKDNLEHKIQDYDNLLQVMRQDNITMKSTQIIKEMINSDSYTWNAYRKAKKDNKVNKTFIKYYDNNYYGLAEWSDEIHKNYFLDAIEEYTVNNPNEKKAKDILKLFKDLEIEDKQDYIEIIEEKVRKTFK